MAEAVLTAPNITLEDFVAFHAAHFSSTSVNHFAEHFLGPVEEEEYTEEAEGDGLGYYEDGVKRTLTDEQIAIFRHSEIQALLRDRRHAEEAKEDEYESPIIETLGPAVDDVPEDNHGEAVIGPVQPVAQDGELEDGELDDGISTPQATIPPPAQNQGNKKNKRKNKNAKKGQRPPQPKGIFKQNVKPDLRKRTWDVVDAGLGNLDYDEESSAASAPTRPAQRRRISYDDD